MIIEIRDFSKIYEEYLWTRSFVVKLLACRSFTSSFEELCKKLIPAGTYSKSTIETTEQCVKSVRS